MANALYVLALVASFAVLAESTFLLPGLLGNSYCRIKSCDRRKHTLCKFTAPRASATCGKVSSNSLTINEIQELLQAYNLYHYKGQKPVQWDEELAKSAQAWANQCNHKIDECRNVERFQVEQSFSYTKTTGPFTPNISKLVIQSDMPKGTTLIGCGVVRYNSDRKYNTTYLVCNYANGGEY